MTIFLLGQGLRLPVIIRRIRDKKIDGPGEWDDPFIFLYKSSNHYSVMGPPRTIRPGEYEFQSLGDVKTTETLTLESRTAIPSTLKPEPRPKSNKWLF